MSNLESEAHKLAVAVNKHIEAGNIASDGELSAAPLLSIAISLKRIADVMQGDEKNTGLIMVLDYIQQRLGPQS